MFIFLRESLLTIFKSGLKWVHTRLFLQPSVDHSCLEMLEHVETTNTSHTNISCSCICFIYIITCKSITTCRYDNMIHIYMSHIICISFPYHINIIYIALTRHLHIMYIYIYISSPYNVLQRSLHVKSQGRGWIRHRRDADSSHNQHKSSQHCANYCGAAQWVISSRWNIHAVQILLVIVVIGFKYVCWFNCCFVVCCFVSHFIG